MVKIIFLWLQATGMTLEWEVDSQTFQISGQSGMAGMWERFFQEGSHPTRRPVLEQAMQIAFNSGTSYCLYSVRKDEKEAEVMSKLRLFGLIEEQFPGATKNQGQ